MLCARQWLREETREHVARRYVLELDLPFLDKVLRVVVLDVDVFRAIVEYWVFREHDTPLVVRTDHHWPLQRNS